MIISIDFYGYLVYYCVNILDLRENISLKKQKEGLCT